MCGLSSNQPFCDGSHKKTADEEADKLYRYNLMEQGLKSNRNNFILFMERIRDIGLFRFKKFGTMKQLLCI
jgi:hypothetical protein